MREYVIFNKDLGLFFGGFDCRYSKYIHKAKIFYNYQYAVDFLNHYRFLTGFKVYSLNEVSKEILRYA